MAMLKMNELKGVIGMRGMGVNNKSEYHFRTNGKVSLLLLLEREALSSELLNTLIADLLNAGVEAESYLLNDENFLLTPEDIYYDGEHFYFCYFPYKEGTAKANLRKLAEYLVGKIDYENEELIAEVHCFYDLATKEESDLRSCLQAYQAFEPVKRAEKEIEEVPNAEVSKVEEAKKRPKLFARKAKNKWGNFEDLLVDEDF